MVSGQWRRPSCMTAFPHARAHPIRDFSRLADDFVDERITEELVCEPQPDAGLLQLLEPDLELADEIRVRFGIARLSVIKPRRKWTNGTADRQCSDRHIPAASVRKPTGRAFRTGSPARREAPAHHHRQITKPIICQSEGMRPQTPSCFTPLSRLVFVRSAREAMISPDH